MAILQGISGLGSILDGAGGNIALAIQQRILRYLKDDTPFAFKTATILNREQIKTGSVTFRKPELLMAEDYGTGEWTPQKMNVGDVTITINRRRKVNVTWDEFDTSRLGEMEYIVDYIGSSLGMIIEADLNSQFWAYFQQLFTGQAGNDGIIKTQVITMPDLVADTITQAEAQSLIFRLNKFIIKLSKTYNKTTLGIKKAEMMFYLDPEADPNIRQAYVNQPNALSERQIAKNLVGYQLGAGVTYVLDNMLGNNIPMNTSFSKDTSLNMTNFIGAIIHNEAIAMPFNFQKVGIVPDPANLNPRIIAKYQFGIGVVRPELCFAIIKQALAPITP